MKVRTIVILGICILITIIFAIYNFLLVPIMAYGWATGAFLITLSRKKVRLSWIDFLNKYSWSYLGVSALLVFLAAVNSIGYHNCSQEYLRCYKDEINDTVINLDRWGKMGKKIYLANGESYGVFIEPLTTVIELERIVQHRKNIVILHKKADNDTLIFVDSYDYKWIFEIADPSLKTIFE